MQIQFIGQGLDETPNSGIGYHLIESLNSNTYNKLEVIVAFVSSSGLENLKEGLFSFKEQGGKIRFFVGADLHGTSKEALEKFLEWEMPTYVTHSPNSITYHPKIYIFRGRLQSRIILGSSNLTTSGLFQNIEANLLIDFENDDKEGKTLIAQILKYYQLIFSDKHPSTKRLSQKLLDVLVEAKIVLPEALNRAKNNAANKTFAKKTSESNHLVQENFEKIKISKPPKGYTRKIQRSNITVKNEHAYSINIEEIELPSGTFWIQTGKMTGGSRNILDLSKIGKREDGIRSWGSVVFFGIQSQNHSLKKSIILVLDGTEYEGNSIFYALGNSNWRMQLKGVTKNGEKLTTISIPENGKLGGFQRKILLFTPLEADKYELSIADETTINQLKALSKEWMKGGKGGTGRAYGITA
ncbi:MAG: phospholipase D-like domain-containing protein [Chitinophagales bacterium]